MVVTSSSGAVRVHQIAVQISLHLDPRPSIVRSAARPEVPGTDVLQLNGETHAIFARRLDADLFDLDSVV
jgi:hypothetical protein